MNWDLFFSIVLVTGGAGIIGVALAQLIGGRIKPRAFAGDLLIGAGAALAGAGRSVPGVGMMPAMMAASAFLVSGAFLRLHERARRERELKEKDAPPQLR